jgi:type II secretory pathway pseudopilin PulG
MICRNSARLRGRRGFTLVETVMAMASVGVVGLSIFYTLYYGLIMFTKNTAMNVSHQEARLALMQLDSDIHSAVSAPSLTDSNGLMISATGASPGVEFQVLVSSTSYCQVTSNVTVGASSIIVGLPPGYPTPYAGMRLIVPTFGIEQNVTAVSVSGTTATCTIAGTAANAITASSGNVIAYFTQRVYYYVTGASSQGGSSTDLVLDYLGVERNQTYMIAANGLINGAPYDPTCATPFSIPSTSSGAPNYHYIQVTGLSTQDPQTTGLSTIFGFDTASIMLSGQVPEYQTLTIYQ